MLTHLKKKLLVAVGYKGLQHRCNYVSNKFIFLQGWQWLKDWLHLVYQDSFIVIPTRKQRVVSKHISF